MVEEISPDTPVLVIGLGRFGAATAGKLDMLGREVLAVDSNADLVQKWSERLTHAVQADARNMDALVQLGAQDFQVAVVAVGEDLESSVLITANLADLGVPEIWAKAASSSHGKILSRIGANRVVYSEADAGHRVAHLITGHMIDYIEFDEDYALIKVHPPKAIVNQSLSDSKIRTRFNVTVVGVRPVGDTFQPATPETVIRDHDTLVVAGAPDDLDAFANRG